MNVILTLLAILGGLVLVVVLAVVVGIAVLKGKLGKALTSLAQGIGPEKLTLQPDTAPPDAEMEQRARNFEALGYERIGHFRIPEMEGVRLIALVSTTTSTYGVVYIHPQVGVWSDVALRYGDAGGLTATSAKMGGELDQRPGYRKIYEPAHTEAQLVDVMRRSVVAGAPLRAVGKELFVKEFEQAYADEMEWRYARGGATLDEIQRIADGSEERFGADVVAQAKALIEEQAKEKLVERCREIYARTVDGATWDEVEERIVVVHERMSPDEAVAQLQAALYHSSVGDRSDELEAQARRVAGGLTSPFVAVERVGELLPQPARWQVVHRIQQPTNAWVLMMPDEE